MGNSLGTYLVEKNGETVMLTLSKYKLVKVTLISSLSTCILSSSILWSTPALNATRKTIYYRNFIEDTEAFSVRTRSISQLQKLHADPVFPDRPSKCFFRGIPGIDPETKMNTINFDSAVGGLCLKTGNSDRHTGTYKGVFNRNPVFSVSFYADGVFQKPFATVVQNTKNYRKYVQGGFADVEFFDFSDPDNVTFNLINDPELNFEDTLFGLDIFKIPISILESFNGQFDPSTGELVASIPTLTLLPGEEKIIPLDSVEEEETFLTTLSAKDIRDLDTGEITSWDFLELGAPILLADDRQAIPESSSMVSILAFSALCASSTLITYLKRLS